MSLAKPLGRSTREARTRCAGAVRTGLFSSGTGRVGSGKGRQGLPLAVGQGEGAVAVAGVDVLRLGVLDLDDVSGHRAVVEPLGVRCAEVDAAVAGVRLADVLVP